MKQIFCFFLCANLTEKENQMLAMLFPQNWKLTVMKLKKRWINQNKLLSNKKKLKMKQSSLLFFGNIFFFSFCVIYNSNFCFWYLKICCFCVIDDSNFVKNLRAWIENSNVSFLHSNHFRNVHSFKDLLHSIMAYIDLQKINHKIRQLQNSDTKTKTSEITKLKQNESSVLKILRSDRHKIEYVKWVESDTWDDTEYCKQWQIFMQGTPIYRFLPPNNLYLPADIKCTKEINDLIHKFQDQVNHKSNK